MNAGFRGITAFVVMCALGGRATAAVFDHSHTPFDRVLKAHVRAAAVDYAALKANPKPLNDYLDALATVPETTFNGWQHPERLAFLLNLYNAATLKLIADHYPVKSIKDIGGFLSGPWKQEVVRLFGRTVTLDHLEHGLVRKFFAEPRVHFALVCAAKGCPPLRAEAYVADRLDTQLEDQGRVFLGQREKNRVDAGARTLYLSPIFKWYGGDFETHSGSVPAALRPYWPDKSPAGYERFAIRHTEYDWSLNESGR